MDLLDRILARLAFATAALAGLCLVLMLGQIVADVVGRLVFSHPLPSTIEIVAEWWMPALIFLPMLTVERRTENITVDLLYDRLGPRGKRVLALFADLAFAVFLGFIGWGAWEQALRAWQEGEFIMGMIPVITWPARFFLPVAAGLTCLHLLLRAARRLTGRAPDAAAPTDETNGASRG